MQFTCQHVVLFFSVLSVTLFILNVLLLWRLDDDQHSVAKKGQHRQVKERVVHISSLKLDKSREYRILENAMTAERMFDKKDITLITHCTLNHLHHLVQLSTRWSGPVSVAVFTLREEVESVIHLIYGLRECYKRIKKRVTFHIVLPQAQFAGQQNVTLDLTEKVFLTNCESFLSEELIRSGQMQNYANIKIPYPNNLLRNVAWHSSRTHLIFVIDIDMVCSVGLRQSFIEFVTRNNLLGSLQGHKDVYVVPAFEINNSNIPKDKEGLIDLWDNGLVQPFYHRICEKCQRNTNYEKWRRDLSLRLDISYTVEWKDPWEPFYIAPRTVPFYDERFRQYGFNRISQVCETHVAGYNFHILNNAFLVHQGFKIRTGFHAQKDAENERNKILFRNLKAELKSKYPDSTRRC